MWRSPGTIIRHNLAHRRRAGESDHDKLSSDRDTGCAAPTPPMQKAQVRVVVCDVEVAPPTRGRCR